MTWRTKAAWREEPWWHWGWPGEREPGIGYWGRADPQHEEPEGGTLKAGIYLPTAEGWELHQVYGDPPTQPDKRKLGL